MKQIARWQSRSGKHYVNLHADEHGHVYDARDAGGSLGRGLSDDDAIAEMQRRVDTGVFQPDANKTPMTMTRMGHLGQQFDEMGESFAKQPEWPVTTDDDKKYGPRARND